MIYLLVEMRLNLRGERNEVKGKSVVIYNDTG
jgi:hypothetical protein